MQMIYLKLITITKSALALFFLFFLNGFSIGNGQQGISYNVKNMKCTGLKAVSYPDTQK